MSDLDDLSRRLPPIPGRNLEGGLAKTSLKFERVLHPTRPFQLRVFLNAPDADESTVTQDNPNYAGSYYFYGQGEMPEQLAIARADRPGFGHPFSFEVEITQSLQGLLTGDGDVQVKLVALDNHGNPVPLNELKLENLTVETE